MTESSLDSASMVVGLITAAQGSIRGGRSRRESHAPLLEAEAGEHALARVVRARHADAPTGAGVASAVARRGRGGGSARFADRQQAEGARRRQPLAGGALGRDRRLLAARAREANQRQQTDPQTDPRRAHVASGTK